MLFLSGFELYSRWVPLFDQHVQTPAQYIPFCGDKRHMQFTFIEGMSNDQLTTEKALSDGSK